MLAPESMLDRSAAEAPFDTVVVVVMENRSFDHFFGWLGTDAAYLAAGQARYGSRFRIDGRQDLTYRDPQGGEVATYWLPGATAEQYPYQGCGAGIPGHGWDVGRAQLAAWVPGARQRQQLVRARLLPGHRHAVPRAAHAPLHHLRPLLRVAARSDVPEPPVRLHGAVRRAPQRPRSAEARHLRHDDDLGPAPGREGARRVLLHRPADPAAVRHALLRRVASPSSRTSRTPRRAACRTS